MEMMLHLDLKRCAHVKKGEECIPGRGTRMSKDRDITQLRYTTGNRVFPDHLVSEVRMMRSRTYS